MLTDGGACKFTCLVRLKSPSSLSIQFSRARTHGHKKYASRCYCRRRVAATSGEDNRKEDEGGNEDVQDMLVSMIKLQTGKAEVNKYVEDESQKLREYVAEACEELDEVGEANKARAELEFGAAMAQLDAEANEVEDLINSTRKQAKEDQAATAAFEERLANERNSGLMFQSLYSSNERKKTLTSAQRESIQEEVDKLNAVTNNQLGENSRMISFGLLGLGLISLGVAALTQGSEFSKYEFGFFLLIFLLLGVQVGYEQQRFTEWKAKESDGDRS